jgi:hypothetical protein
VGSSVNVVFSENETEARVGMSPWLFNLYIDGVVREVNARVGIWQWCRVVV